MTEDLERLVRVFVGIRDKKNELSRAFKAQETELNGKLDTIKHALLAHCKDTNSESVRTDAGTFYRTVKTRYWTSDWESLYKFIVEEKVPDLLEKRIQQTHMREFLDDNPDVLPPGINTDSEYTINVRKPKS